MHRVKRIQLNIRLVALLAVTVAVLLAASSLAPPRQASAVVGPFAFEGVICLEATQTIYDQASLILIRFDPVKNVSDEWDLSLVAYEGDTDDDGAADVNVGSSCNPADDTNTFNALVDFQFVNTLSRPSARATLNGASTEISWSGGCTFQEDNNLWVDATFTIDVTGKKTFGKNDGTLNAVLYPPDQECVGTPSGTVPLITRTVMRTSAPAKGVPQGDPVADDWDNDGITDWNELARKSQFAGNGCDPFNAADDLCTSGSSSVGGVAELAEAAGTPLEAPDSSGSNTGLIAGIVAAIAAGVVSLSGAVLYARRRSIQ